MRARCSFHGQAYRSTPDPVIVAGPDARTQTTVPGSYKALCGAVDGHRAELETFYSGVGFDVVSSARVFPHITSFTGETRGQAPLRRLCGSCSRRYQGGIRKIVVKFTEVYNDAAHALLAAQALAPRCSPAIGLRSLALR